MEFHVIERTSELQTAVDALETEIAERARLEREVLKISDREQARIGRDLHDGPCQNIASIAVLAEIAAREMKLENQNATASLNEISQIARHSIDEIQSLSKGLFPVKIEEYGLELALQELAAETMARSTARCSFTMRQPITFTDPAAAIQLYRIAQEAISNALRHGRARNVAIELEMSNGTVRLMIQDDGIGIQPGTKKSGLGLHTMDYRAKMLGGSLEMGPGSEGGTTVICSFPGQEFIQVSSASNRG